MPLVGLQCPKGGTVPLDPDLSHCRDCKKRCLTLPTLHYIAKSERVWTGNPSTTQLLNGTRLEFLKITKDYTIDPRSRMFAIHGNLFHALMAKEAKELGLPAEMALSPDGRDIFDVLEPNDGTWGLTDYKTWGSFRVARALGIVKSGKGKDATFGFNSDVVDLWESELQLNNYRRKLAPYGYEVGNMQLQVAVRDGGLAMAKTRGIKELVYIIPIRRLDDNYVDGYFAGKANDLLQALKEYEADPKYLPQPCDLRECWDGARCRGWCDVAEFCPQGILAKQTDSNYIEPPKGLLTRQEE